jgi:hypothetical protein
MYSGFSYVVSSLKLDSVWSVVMCFCADVVLPTVECCSCFAVLYILNGENGEFSVLKSRRCITLITE